MNNVSTATCLSHWVSFRATNSGPLSLRICLGDPRTANKYCNTAHYYCFMEYKWNFFFFLLGIIIVVYACILKHLLKVLFQDLSISLCTHLHSQIYVKGFQLLWCKSCNESFLIFLFYEEMCLLLKSCGLYYGEAIDIVILLTTKGSWNISVQSHSLKFIISDHFIFPLGICSFLLRTACIYLWYPLSVLQYLSYR